MSKDPFSKLQSSLPLEDLLAQPNVRNSQNWLLTYLDVFVLIVMLVITLITLSDISTEQQATATKLPAIKPEIFPACPSVNVAPAPAPAVVACLPPVVAEQKNEIKPDSSLIETRSKQSNDIVTTPSKMPEIQVAGTVMPVTAPDVDKRADETKLQQRLVKTINEFGLNKAVNIKVTQGYAQLEIQDNVLFKSSEANLTISGEALLKRLVPLLKQAVGLILIEGHTDNIPIKTAQFPSNWELGSSRATSVLHFLVSQQLDSSHLRAMTYADTMPIADNATAEGREKNRRVNLLIKFSEQ